MIFHITKVLLPLLNINVNRSKTENGVSAAQYAAQATNAATAISTPTTTITKNETLTTTIGDSKAFTPTSIGASAAVSGNPIAAGTVVTVTVTPNTNTSSRRTAFTYTNTNSQSNMSNNYSNNNNNNSYKMVDVAKYSNNSSDNAAPTVGNWKKIDRHLETIQSKLKEAWSVHLGKEGRLYYCNHLTQTAGWLPSCEDWSRQEELPYGWERAIDSKGRTYYIK